MRSLGDFKDLRIPLATGILDGRSSAGEPTPLDFRILLNVDTQDESGRARMGGFTAWKTASSSNEDLHDQLLGGAGHIVDGEFVSYVGQREVITLLAEARHSSGVYYSIAATKSRIYCSTGQCRNWRIIADNLSGGYVAGDSPWPNVTWQFAQVGDYAFFTNNIDPVLVWPIGGAVIDGSQFATQDGYNPADYYRRWAAYEIPDLVGLNITRAGVVAGWNGFLFAADTVVEGTRYPSRIYWSDGGAPLVFAPGGNSLAGYMDLGGGETILRIDTIGGQMRCYTDKAIYSITLVGGDLVFQIQEIYRGDLALAFPNSFINAGQAHIWWVQDSIVSLGAYDRIPNRLEWIHRAAGFIFRGLDGSFLKDCPIAFSAFNPLDRSKCNQIAAGFDENLGNVWFSWPTQRNSDETPDDPNDFEGVRRMSLVINPRYQKATLVDHAFSAFAVMRKHQWKTVRDFLIEYGVCSANDLLSDDKLIAAKEGAPLNNQQPPETLPAHLWNEAENPNLPKSDDSLAAQVCSVRLALDCNKCIPTPKFAMASVVDFCIKEFDLSARLREIYLPQSPAVWIPANESHFPNVVESEYTEAGYPTLIQGEVSKWGVSSEKIITRIKADYDAESQTVPGKLCAQLGVSNSPRCVDWHDAEPIALDCLRADVDESDERALAPAMFPFYRAGQWLAYRIFIASGDTELNYSPTGCGMTLNQVEIRARPKSETWSNQ